MANGKIIYPPPLARALSLDEAHYFSLADTPAFNVGTGDFVFSCLFYLDSSIGTPTNTKLLAGKGSRDLTSAPGWWVALVPQPGSVEVSFNDGSLTQVYVNSANASVLGDRWYLLEVVFNRDENCSIYLFDLAAGTGGLIKTGAISSRPNSWSNTNAFWVGNWGADAGRYFKGYLGILRLDMGRALPEGEITAEEERVRFGCIPEIADSTALWPFADSLVDLSAAAYTLTWQGGGSPAYVDGWPSAVAPLTYIFEENFECGYEWGYLDFDDNQRAADGSSFTDAGPLKKYFHLPFKQLPISQQAALTAAYQSRVPFQFFLDADRRRTCMAKFAAPPPFIHQFLDRAEVSLDLEES
ncbi:MAG: hypothetical protein HY743_05055 [Deltaproteobacteria bacterium]|nr:hypothetical protein [Deltaproteobacteria bacterium]